ncbi:MAG: hypothetical protein IID45_11455 [Planctomycetes bacterium]|nr:hypothetical protein [Planctomycetota bacterium]
MTDISSTSSMSGDEPDSAKTESSSVTKVTTPSRRARWGRRFGDWFVNLPPVRNRVPARYRPALFLESFYNIGTGAFVCLFLLSTVVLKTVVGGTATHLAILAAMFGGSSLLSPIVSYCGRKIPMRSLVVYPNLIVAALLLATVFTGAGATFFTIFVGLAFVFRVFPRVGEMNMYRVIYPASHRGGAVGWVKAIAAISALAVTLLGYCWFSFQPNLYWIVYWLVAVILVGSAMCYARIPVSRKNIFEKNDGLTPYQAFWQGLKIFISDKRFLSYQLGFSLAGFANHMAMIYVAEVLSEDVIGDRSPGSLLPGFLSSLLVDNWNLSAVTIKTLIVGFIFAVMPMVLMTVSAALWGRFLDRTNPMTGRAIFNTFQFAAYACHAYGGMTLQIWPMFVGAMLHAIGNGGSTINWLTGSLYFAKEDQISLYNAVHVGLTGLRGLIAPLVGLYLLSSGGLNIGAGIFWVASGLSLLGAVVMLIQGLTDPGPRE